MIWSEHNLAENPNHDWAYSFDGFDPDYNYWILKSGEDDEEILAFIYHNEGAPIGAKHYWGAAFDESGDLSDGDCDGDLNTLKARIERYLKNS